MEKNEKECFKNLEPKAFERVNASIKGGIESGSVSEQQATVLKELISKLKTTKDVFLVLVSMFALSSGKDLMAYQALIRHLLSMKMVEELAELAEHLDGTEKPNEDETPNGDIESVLKEILKH